MIACLFGTYDRGHSANRLLAETLVCAGFEVVECHEPVWEPAGEKPARYFSPGSLARLAVRWAGAARRLARRWQALAAHAPLVVVGFGGQLDVLLARRICRGRAGLVFAPLVSLTETLVEDRAVFAAGGPSARALGALDRATFRAADLVLADTAAHAAYLAELGAPRERLAVCYLGVEPEFRAARTIAPVPGRVLFTGRYLPLHGLDTIVAAARQLRGRAEVVLLGAGPERPRIEALARTTDAAIVWRDPVSLDALADELAAASVVLGVFGAGRKAAMVVPNKVYQAAAAGRPLVTRDSPALREVLVPDVHCLAVPAASADALAAAVLRLLDDAPLAERLGRAARAHVLARFSPERQGAALAALVGERLGVASGRATPRRAADA